MLLCDTAVRTSGALIYDRDKKSEHGHKRFLPDSEDLYVDVNLPESPFQGLNLSGLPLLTAESLVLVVVVVGGFVVVVVASL